MNKMTTTNLAKFGNREKAIAGDLLYAMSKHGLPKYFDEEDVTVMFNFNSGYVFLTNSELQAAMLTDDNTLEIWHNCPECGCEGFIDDIKTESENDCCIEYLEQFE